jgi:hypothetical protein
VEPPASAAASGHGAAAASFVQMSSIFENSNLREKVNDHVKKMEQTMEKMEQLKKGENTLETSGEDVKLHSKRVGKIGNYTRNEWGRCDNYTRNERGRCENNTLNEWRRSEIYTQNEWRRSESYTRNGWRRSENYTRNGWRRSENCTQNGWRRCIIFRACSAIQ